MPNRLLGSCSPYLLQHAHNPVDWYPWGPEAFAAARDRGVPIFLSIGYSTCYWCHVMERECFENPEIAAEMNRRFVNIKVDREERPDVDQLYMTAVQVLTRQGGWPLSVFLTPDLRPFYGGTYFPPHDVHLADGQTRPGFPRLLAAIDDAWHNRRPELEQTADQVLSILHQLSLPRRPAPPSTPAAAASPAAAQWGLEKLAEWVARSAADFDPVYGGYGPRRGPKFPRQTLLKLLTEFGDLAGTEVVAGLRHTLDALARGGIRDHLGGGFHRYSTDGQWRIPHFEIMLYDQAMLAEVFAAHPQHASVARDICHFVLREMTGPQGQFYTALDAEVDGREGLNYLWTDGEIRQTLGPEDAAVFSCVYGVDQGPNFRDPHHPEEPPRNVLFLDRAIPQAAFEHGFEVADFEAKLAQLRAQLKAVRDRRKQPLLDTKVITAWNALMASALARCGRALGEEHFTRAAEGNVDFLLARHTRPDGGLWRISRDGTPAPLHAGTLEDYAYLAQACLDVGRRQDAERIARDMLRRFGGDPAVHDHADHDSASAASGCGACGGGGCGGGGCGGGGGLYTTDLDADDLIVRQKTATDTPLPNPNAVAALVCLDLGWHGRAAAILTDFAAALDDNAEAMSAMALAFGRYVRKVGPLALPPPRIAHAGSHGPDQGPPPSPEQEAARVVTLSAEEVSTAAGSDDRLIALTLRIAPGFHLYAPTGSADTADSDAASAGVPVRLTPTTAHAAVTYPPPTRKTLAGRSVPVYEGEVTLQVRGLWPHSEPFEALLEYQPCDDTRCLPVVRRTVQIVR